jgi:hypothetical protein
VGALGTEGFATGVLVAVGGEEVEVCKEVVLYPIPTYRIAAAPNTNSGRSIL